MNMRAQIIAAVTPKMLHPDARVRNISAVRSRMPGFPQVGDEGTVGTVASDRSQCIVIFDRFKDGCDFPADGSDGPFKSTSHKVLSYTADLEALGAAEIVDTVLDMLERPTEAMISAGCTQAETHEPGDPGIGELTMESCFQAMIRAAKDNK